jgi:hypothetical protein
MLGHLSQGFPVLFIKPSDVVLQDPGKLRIRGGVKFHPSSVLLRKLLFFLFYPRLILTPHIFGQLRSVFQVLPEKLSHLSHKLFHDTPVAHQFVQGLLDSGQPVQVIFGLRESQITLYDAEKPLPDPGLLIFRNVLQSLLEVEVRILNQFRVQPFSRLPGFVSAQPLGVAFDILGSLESEFESRFDFTHTKNIAENAVQKKRYA